MRGGETHRRMAVLLRVAVHLLVAALVLELAARVDDRLTYGAPLWKAYGPEILRRVDPGGFPQNVPGVRFEKWRINGLGFRGGEIQRDKAPGTLRIACLGQSESFGLYESEGGEWPARLGALLAPRGVEVVNASVVGLGRRGRRPYLEGHVLPLRPDVLVLYVNVLAELGSSRPSDAGASPSEPPPSWARSRFLAKLRIGIRGVVPASMRARLREWRIDRALRSRRQAEPGGGLADVLPAVKVVAFEEHLRELIRAARSSGATPVLVTYPVLVDEPNREAFHLQIADEQTWHPGWSELGLLDGQRKLNEAVLRVGREREAPVVDLAAAVPRTLEYFADDVHYTDRGAALIAERLRAALDEAGLLGLPAQGRTVPARVPGPP
jgi:lysophospholipase L1-like esterase